MSFIKTSHIARKKKKQIDLVSSSTIPFSLLLAPAKRSLTPNIYQMIQPQRNIFFNKRYRDNTLQFESTAQSFRKKKQAPVKACTIDFKGLNFNQQQITLRNNIKLLTKSQNSKSLRMKKVRSFRQNPQPSKMYSTLNSSFDLRVNSLEIRAQFQNDGHQFFKQIKKIKLRDKQIRNINYSASKIRLSRTCSFKCPLHSQLLPWESIQDNQN